MSNTITRVDFARALQHIDASPARSAWARGVKDYAINLLDELEQAVIDGDTDPDALADPARLEAEMLNGARDWTQYSWGGSALIYDGDIARALCAPWELKRTLNGQRRPNASEAWLDVQARALYQAARIVHAAIEAATVTLEALEPAEMQAADVKAGA